MTLGCSTSVSGDPSCDPHMTWYSPPPGQCGEISMAEQKQEEGPPLGTE